MTAESGCGVRYPDILSLYFIHKDSVSDIWQAANITENKDPMFETEFVRAAFMRAISMDDT